MPKPELSHQAQANLKIPEHRADVAKLRVPDPARGVNFATVTAPTSTLNKAAAGPTTNDKEIGEVNAGDGRATGKAAEEKAKWKTDFYTVRYSNMQNGNCFPFVLEAQGFLHARGRLAGIQGGHDMHCRYD
jgi:hypothetical protein